MKTSKTGSVGGAAGVSARPELSRRSALVGAVGLPLSLALPAALLGCSREPKCNDISGMSPEDKNARIQAAGYVELSPDFTKRCDRCMHFTPGSENQCGGCKVVAGPIDPKGTCKLFVAKT